MINIKELRIGNVLTFSGVGIDIDTGVIRGGGSEMEVPIEPLTFMLLIKFPHFINEFKPIELTPEIARDRIRSNVKNLAGDLPDRSSHLGEISKKRPPL